MSDAATPLCEAVYPKATHLTCLKPQGHTDEHVTCLGYHPRVVEEDGQPWEAEGEYEWDEWSATPSAPEERDAVVRDRDAFEVQARQRDALASQWERLVPAARDVVATVGCLNKRDDGEPCWNCVVCALAAPLFQDTELVATPSAPPQEEGQS